MRNCKLSVLQLPNKGAVLPTTKGRCKIIIIVFPSLLSQELLDIYCINAFVAAQELQKIHHFLIMASAYVFRRKMPSLTKICTLIGRLKIVTRLMIKYL